MIQQVWATTIFNFPEQRISLVNNLQSPFTDNIQSQTLLLIIIMCYQIIFDFVSQIYSWIKSEWAKIPMFQDFDMLMNFRVLVFANDTPFVALNIVLKNNYCPYEYDLETLRIIKAQFFETCLWSDTVFKKNYSAYCSTCTFY